MHITSENKIYSIEQIDEVVVKRVIEGLKEMKEDFKILVCPDHPTPISTMTHCSDPVPYIIYSSKKQINSGVSGYDEAQAQSTGNFIEIGYNLIKKLFEN